MTTDLFFGTSSTDTATPAVNDIALVSASIDGTAGNGMSYVSAISADGRYVVFDSEATNLVADGGGDGIFIKDFQTGVITRVSTNSDGAWTWGGKNPSISADGRFVAFESGANNLVEGDTNDQTDIFVKDMQTGAVTRVSTDSSGAQADSGSSMPRISADGRHVVFQSYANNLIAGESIEWKANIFKKDLDTGITTRINTSVDGGDANEGTYDSAMVSGDGRYVVFDSWASNLVAGDDNELCDAFLKDTQTGTMTRLSGGTGFNTVERGAYYPSISNNGRYVVFDSYADNLVPGDTNGKGDIYMVDTQTGTMKRVSLGADGTEGNGNSFNPSISDDGRFVAFRSSASNLVAGDTNGTGDVFVKDMVTGALVRVSTSADGTEGKGWSSKVQISADGRYLAFTSDASNLAPGDANGTYDIFRVANPLAGSGAYLFGPGSGEQAIDDNNAATADTIRFDGVAAADVLLYRDTVNLYLALKGTADVLTVSGWFADATHQVQKVEFADTTWDAAMLETAAMAVVGTSGTVSAPGNGDDILLGQSTTDKIAGKAGNDTIYGGAGDDMLDGGIGDDFLGGGEGNDILAGGLGVDILNGGAGNDLLNGGLGNDVYQFGLGAGQDRIVDTDHRPGNSDLITFGAGIDASQLWFRRAGKDLEVSVIGTTDTLTIADWYVGSANRIEQFRTASDRLLAASEVELLVRAMSDFAPPVDGARTLPQNYQDALSAVMASAWK